MTDKAKNIKAKNIKAKGFDVEKTKTPSVGELVKQVKESKREVGSELIVDRKTLEANVSDVEIFGNDDWKLLSKAESKAGEWMKSTKALSIQNSGCLIQVTTKNKGNVAEALEFIPGVRIIETSNEEGTVTARYIKKI